MVGDHWCISAQSRYRQKLQTKLMDKALDIFLTSKKIILAGIYGMQTYSNISRTQHSKHGY